jgi:hypothetical protein
MTDLHYLSYIFTTEHIIALTPPGWFKYSHAKD